MAPRSRILAYGIAAMLVLAGALCALLVDGLTGQVLSTVLMSLGFVAAVLLAFLEVGLSEDRERAREARLRRKPARRGLDRAPRGWPGRPPRRPR